ncbi:MAG: Trm112 family protein [Pseudomonadota bacterium]
MTDQDITENENADDQENTKLDPKFLEFLVCPLTKTSLDYDAENNELISRAAKLAYPIRKGIPIMIPQEARSLEDDG